MCDEAFASHTVQHSVLLPAKFTAIENQLAISGQGERERGIMWPAQYPEVTWKLVLMLRST